MSTLWDGTVPSEGGGFGGTVGIDVVFSHYGRINGVWHYQPVGGPAAVTVGVFDAITRALVGPTAYTDVLTFNAWNYVALDAPVAIVPGAVYTVSVLTAGSARLFPAGTLDDYVDNGDITAIHHGGRYSSSGTVIDYPATFDSSGAVFAVDVEFEAIEPPAVPVGELFVAGAPERVTEYLPTDGKTSVAVSTATLG